MNLSATFLAGRQVSAAASRGWGPADLGDSVHWGPAWLGFKEQFLPRI